MIDCVVSFSFSLEVWFGLSQVGLGEVVIGGGAFDTGLLGVL